jgi:hypothetical protein
MPICPDPSKLNPPKKPNDVLWLRDKQSDYSIRGAMNAGAAVFMYLNDLAQGKGKVAAQVQYNQCEDYKPSP